MPQAHAKVAAMLASPDDVEQQFYEALREGDLDRLLAVWAEDEEVVCVHPGGPRLVGTVAVRAAFAAVFSHGGVAVQLDQVRRVHTLSCAIHSVTERVEVRIPEGLRVGWVVATNVYIKTTLGWRMAAHHASPATATEPVEVMERPAVLH